MKTKSIFHSVATITFFAIITRLLGFFLRIYLSRAVGAEALGKYQIALSVLSVLLTVIASGIPLTISKMTSAALSDKQKTSKMISSATIYTAVLSCVLCALALALWPVFNIMFSNADITLVLMSMLPAIIFSSFYCVARGYLWGKSNFFAVCLAELFEQIARVIACVLLFCLLPTVAGELLTGISLSIACFASMIFAIVLFFVFGGRMSKPDKSYITLAKTSTPITLIRVVASLSILLVSIILPNRLMAAGYTSSQALTLLGIATGMTLPLLFVPSTLVGSLSVAIIPELSAAKTQNDNSHISNRVKSSISFALFVSCFLVPLFVGVGEQVGLFFFKSKESGLLLARSAWIMIPMGLTNISSAILNGLGYEKVSFASSMVGTFVMLILLWFLPAVMGVYALFFAMGLCMTISAAINLVAIKKKTGVFVKIAKPLFLICAVSLPTAAIASFVCGILQNFFTLFFSLAISCTISFLFFATLLWMMGALDVSQLYVKIKKIKFKLPKKLKTKKKK